MSRPRWLQHLTTKLSIRFFRYLTFAVYVLCFSPVWGALAWWHFGNLKSDAAEYWFNASVVITLGFSGWLAFNAGYYMGSEAQSFGIATKRALSPLVIRLSFFPVIGRFFDPLASSRGEANRQYPPRQTDVRLDHREIE